MFSEEGHTESVALPALPSTSGVEKVQSNIQMRGLYIYYYLYVIYNIYATYIISFWKCLFFILI